jgi:hypothetical protein
MIHCLLWFESKTHRIRPCLFFERRRNPSGKLSHVFEHLDSDGKLEDVEPQGTAFIPRGRSSKSLSCVAVETRFE